MIFRLNHLLLLSGNNFLSFAIVLLLGMGCGGSKKLVDPHKTAEGGLTPTFDQYNPKTGQVEKTTGDKILIDTVEWNVVEKEEFPPITNPEIVAPPFGPSIESQFLDQYNITFLLPFLNNQFDRIRGIPDDKSMLALNYYYGAKLALNELSKEGLNLTVNVYDTQASESITESLLNSPTVAQSNLIIGPAKKENVKKVAQYSRKNGITMFSPFNASSAMGTDNPFYVQIRPTLATHAKTIMEHALKHYQPEQITLVVRDKGVEKKRLNLFQAHYPLNTGIDSTGKFKELILPGDLRALSEFDLMSTIKQDMETVFIVPSWSNESFIYSFLRQIRVVKGLNSVVVYGMPQWTSYERISYDYFEALDVHVSSEFFVDKESSSVKSFQTRFFDSYGFIPSDNAYKGYDQMLFLGRRLKNDGTFWQKNRKPELGSITLTEFSLAPVTKRQIPDPLEGYPMDRFESQKVSILEFKDYRFRKAN